jgi:hypothetical protein
MMMAEYLRGMCEAAGVTQGPVVFHHTKKHDDGSHLLYKMLFCVGWRYSIVKRTCLVQVFNDCTGR